MHFVTALRRRRGRRPAPSVEKWRASPMPAHLTAMDGGNAEGWQEQSRLTAMDGGNAVRIARAIPALCRLQAGEERSVSPACC
jgi:hypothetical protein